MAVVECSECGKKSEQGYVPPSEMGAQAVCGQECFDVLLARLRAESAAVS